MARPATEPSGWFLLGAAYCTSARELYGRKIRMPHADAPPRFLYYHAVELFLKAYLISKGMTEREVRAIGHKVKDLGNACNARGLRLRKEAMLALDLIDFDGNMFAARYLSIGYRVHLAEESLAEVVEYLRTKIRKKLRAAGIPVR